MNSSRITHHSSLNRVQPAQTGGVMSSCEPSAGGPLSRPPLFSHERRPGYSSRALEIMSRAEPSPYPARANKTQIPIHLRRRGRLFLNGTNERAMYIGPNAGLVCEICGCESTVVIASERPVWLQKFLLALARKRYHKRHGGTCVGNAENTAVKIAKGYDRIAAVLAKTVAHQGDAFELDDNEALILIMDVLNDIDPTLIERNAKKKLARPRRSS
jgi:hypothetical protein